jgi:hypothetical protein
MDDYTMTQMALGMIAQAVIHLSITWFIAYALLGSFVKVGLIRFINKDLEPRSRRFSPVFLSHCLFSIIFANPYMLFLLDHHSSDFYFIGRNFGLFLLIYFTVLPVMLDILFLRIVPRTKLFRWLLWTPPLKQVIIISVVICLVSSVAGWFVAH